jgi:hypothetical protein
LNRPIDQLLPDQLNLLADFLDFLRSQSFVSAVKPSERKPGLHPGAFVISDDFDAPLPDSFWLGEE